MPVIKHINNEEYELVVWNVTEPNDLLLSSLSLSQEQLEKYYSLSEKRKKEYLGIRASMQVLGRDDEVFYDEKGKPYIKDNMYISFSHSYGKVAVAISKFPIGVDIELERNKKIRNIESKFIREDEALFIPDNHEKDAYLHIIWGIKEGLYKLNGGNLWNFLHHYKVESFDLQEYKPIYTWVMDENSSNKYAAFYTLVENYYLVWVLDILDL